MDISDPQQGTASGSRSGQHGLLRLFNSDLFSGWMALRYLHRYDTAVGVHHLLCLRLREFARGSARLHLAHLLPQLLQLAVSRPEASSPLECFLMEQARASSHVAAVLLWLLECYIADYSAPSASAVVSSSSSSSSSSSAAKAEPAELAKVSRVLRLLFEVQRAAFGREAVRSNPILALASNRRRRSLPPVRDNRPPALSSPSPSSSLHPASVLAEDLPSVMGTLAGFGISLLAFGQPRASVALKPLALMEARTPLYAEISSCLLGTRQHDGPFSASFRHRQPPHPHQPQHVVVAQPLLSPVHASSPSLEELHRGDAFAVRSSTAPSLSDSAVLAMHRRRKPSHHQGSPSSPNLLYLADMQFVVSLLEISKRLCRVGPKEARVRALRAELGLVNHNLPAAVCLPFLCDQRDDGHCAARGSGHHRLLRIPSSEATVLNSAERVPYLLFVEVLDPPGPDDRAWTIEELRAMAAQPSFLSTGDDRRPRPLQPSLDSFSDSSLESAPGADQQCGDGPGSPDSQHPHGQNPNRPDNQSPYRPDSQSPNGSDSQNPNGSDSQNLNGSNSQNPHCDMIESVEREERMRTAAIMLAQLNRQAGLPGSNPTEIDAIRARLLGEMEMLERERLLDAVASGGTPDASMATAVSTTTPIMATAAAIVSPGNPVRQIRDDPSASVLREPFPAKQERIRRHSPFGRLPGWRLLATIVKADADMRQELLAVQLIEELRCIFAEEAVDAWLSDRHRVQVAGPMGGLLEVIPGSLSVHSIKKAAWEAGLGISLLDHYTRQFRDGDALVPAVLAFARSLAGYSLFTHVFQVKDRHNGNILIDAEGHLVHIDFGFLLSNTPGGSYSAVVTGGGGFETAPFKFTGEYMELLQAVAPAYPLFKDLLKRGFLALRKHQERLIALLEGYALYGSALPCMSGGGPSVLQGLAQRLVPGLSDRQVEQHVERLVAGSAQNMFTRLYDAFQYYSNGIL